MICTKKQLNIIKEQQRGNVAGLRRHFCPETVKNNPYAVYVVQMGSQCEIRRSSSLSPVSHDVTLLTRW